MASGRNLLVIVASGLRSDALEDERVWPLKTPGFKRLARRGLRLVAHAACPAEPGGLISLMTGQHARQHGRVWPGEAVACLSGLPTWLADAGYHVAGVGCLGPFASTFAESVVVEPAGEVDPERCAYRRHAEARGLWPAIAAQRSRRAKHGPFAPDRLLLDAADDVDGFIAGEARRVALRLPGDKPWALFVVFSGPGNDLPPPPPYSELVKPELVSDGFTPVDLRRVGVLAEPAYPLIELQRLERHALARIRADYLGRVALVDSGVGRVADAVAQRGDRSRTWAVVASDGGYLLGERGLVGRRSFLSGAVETPVIVAGPPGGRLPNREQVDGLFSTVDVSATVAALAGADLPAASAGAGRSLLPLWQGEAVAPVRGGVLSELGERVMLETERFKAVYGAVGDDAGACLAVFDLLNDPDERTSLGEAAIGKLALDGLRLRLLEAVLPLRGYAA